MPTGETVGAVRSQIAKAPVTGAMAIAIKLAMGIHECLNSEPDAEGDFDEIDAACVLSVYQRAVEACGYDPVAEMKKASERGRVAA